MVTILIISFLWAFLEGRREAQYFHYKWSLSNPTKVKDEHFEFTLQRFLVVLSGSCISFLLFGPIGFITTFLGIAFSFSYFHNGSYYLRRNQIDNSVYKLRWKDASLTTTAKTSFSYKTRFYLFLFGFITTFLVEFWLFRFNI